MKKQIPNILSLIRLALAPVFVAVFFSGVESPRLWAALIYGVACLTDVLDGRIARKYGVTSALGRIIDPLADKLMIFCVLLCITISGIIPIWALCLFLFKELLMGMGAFIMYKKRSGVIISANVLGKASTVCFFLCCVALLVWEGISDTLATVFISAALLVTLAALFNYMWIFFHANSNIKRRY